MKLIEGISQSIGTKNELLFALSLRALIEHSCIIDDAKEKVEVNRNFLTNTIWGSERHHLLKPLQDLINLRKELMLLAVGHNIQLDTNMPDDNSSKKAWQKFISSARRKVPDQFKLKKGVMYYIDRCADRNDFFLLRYIYELLCEFCHPNMNARSLSFIPNDFGESVDFQNSPIKGFSYGFYFIFKLGQDIIPFITNRINVALEVFNSCLKPMPSLSENEMKEKQNSVRVIDEFGREIWVDKKNIGVWDCEGIPLSSEHLVRVKKIFYEIWDVCGTNLENWIKGIQRELYIEQEILIWEKIVRLFKEELQMRKVVSFEIKNKVYNTLRLASLGYDLDEIANQMPELKELPFFERVVNKYIKAR